MTLVSPRLPGAICLLLSTSIHVMQMSDCFLSEAPRNILKSRSTRLMCVQILKGNMERMVSACSRSSILSFHHQNELNENSYIKMENSHPV